MGHRASVDFDFFSDRPLDKAELAAAFPFIARAQVLQDQPSTLAVNVPDELNQEEHVKISFFGSIGFGRGVSLDRGLSIALAMYGNQFQPAESLKAMTYFQGGDLNVLTGEEKRTLIEAARAVRELPQVARQASELSMVGEGGS